MSFFNPVAFFALSLSALVVAVYFLKKRPQPFEVSALFLWPEAISRSRTSWRWYKAPLPLLALQLLALALLVLGASQPAIFTQARGAGKLALIVDTSASMQTRTERGTRLEQALQRAVALVDNHPDAQFTLIESRAGGGVLVPLTEDGAHVRSAILGLQASYRGDAPVDDVVQWAQSQGSWSSFDRVLWLTDRQYLDPLLRDFPVEFDLQSGGLGNAAITAFMVRLQPDASLGYEGFVRVQNFSTAPLSTTLTLHSGARLVFNAPLELAAQEDASFTFPLSQSVPKLLTASLEVQDAGAFDNERHFTFQAQVLPRVFWWGEHDRFLEQALRALGVEQTLEWSPETAMQPSDLLVVNGLTLPRGFRGNALLVNGDWEDMIHAELLQPVERLQATDLSHPILRGLTPENIAVLQMRLSRLDPRMAPLLQAQVPAVGGAHPLMAAYQSADTRLVWIGFSLQDSNLRLTVDFPILVSNLLRWLVPLPLEPSVLETGAPLFLEKAGLEVTLPSQQTVESQGTVFLATEEPGFYAVEAGQAWALNVPAAESRAPESAQTAPVDLTPRPNAQTASTAHPLWLYMAWLGLLALGLEWACYERGWL